jgi:hypothetical protein
MRFRHIVVVSCALLALAGCGDSRRSPDVQPTEPVAVVPLTVADLLTTTRVAGLSIVYEQPFHNSHLQRVPGTEMNDGQRIVDWLEKAKAAGAISGYSADCALGANQDLRLDVAMVGGEIGRVLLILRSPDPWRARMNGALSVTCAYVYLREPGVEMAQVHAQALGFTDLALEGMLENDHFGLDPCTVYAARRAGAGADPKVRWSLMVQHVDGGDHLIGFMRRDVSCDDMFAGNYVDEFVKQRGTLQGTIEYLKDDLAKVAARAWTLERMFAGETRVELAPMMAHLQKLVDRAISASSAGWDAADLGARLALERTLRALVATGSIAPGHTERAQAHAARVAELDAAVAVLAAAAESKGLAATAAGWNLVRTRLASDALAPRTPVSAVVADVDAAPLAAARRSMGAALQRLMPVLALPAARADEAAALFARGGLLAGRPVAELLGLELGGAWDSQAKRRWTVAIGDPDPKTVAVATRIVSKDVPYNVYSLDDRAMEAQFEGNRAWARNQIAEEERAVAASDDYLSSESYRTVTYGSERGALFNGKDSEQYGRVHYKRTETGTRTVVDEQMKRRNEQSRARLAMAQETLATGGSATTVVATHTMKMPVEMRWQDWTGAVTRPVTVEGAPQGNASQSEAVDQQLLDTDGFAKGRMDPVHQWTTREAVIAAASARLDRKLVPHLAQVVDAALPVLCSDDVAARMRDEWTPAESDAEVDWLRWLVGIQEPAARSLPEAYLKDVVSLLRAPKH